VHVSALIAARAVPLEEVVAHLSQQHAGELGAVAARRCGGAQRGEGNNATPRHVPNVYRKEQGGRGVRKAVRVLQGGWRTSADCS
jgi:hypothetical protein